MLLWLKALGMCQSMFCAIPCFWHGWDERARGKMLLCLPFVGLEIGLLWWGAGILSRFLSPLLGAAVLAFFPWIATGALHLDGFLDVVDAVRSCRDLERRREILKDSHVGAFAVIGCMLLGISQYAVCASLGSAPLGLLVWIPAVSRCCSVLAVNGLAPMQTSQYAGQTHKPGDLVFPAAVLLLLLGSCAALYRLWALVLLGELAVYALVLRRSYRALGGMNGDISGYCLTLSELAACAAMAVGASL
ncbi:MAG: adenosylcobinamide-GDP ribazoletransferase [Clostridiales bacterium]|nr:adenosylcobinamide-GDP ribazoletransferase [Clostridiales bacterium]